ncbi:MAG: hypothetical protein H6721_33585 [Sandaracinus sp.]|nr:hypothetical protein [Sandaracinus sp.]MCB9637068.1 hypothetical protein [Sandaracinus sp.]
MITIFLDPDGTHDLGHYVLVAASTGVRYETQCHGLATEVRGAEGFLISAGPSAAAEALIAFARRADRRSGPRPIAEWPDAERARLRSLVAAVSVWTREGEEDRPTSLTLDESHLDEGFEAWIPVQTALGPGWFLGPNGD